MSGQELQSYVYTSKYATYDADKKRRSLWGETVDRVMNMHIKKYPHIEKDIRWAFEHVKEKKVLGSQRALQFGGKPIEKTNARMFNCISSYCDRVRFFQECIWLLLCGCGTGFSVQTHHVDKLPNFHANCLSNKPVKAFVIPDSIEGWADALGVLMATFMPHEDASFSDWKDYTVELDYSQIRKKGSMISSGVGKAPGPDPLRNSLNKIKNLLVSTAASYKKLRTIDAYDIVMYASDAVLSGGVRRSATLAMFSIDDQDMVTAKTGNWFVDNPQRARSNNSALLIRGEVKRKDFMNLIDSVRQFGEPGFIWADSTESLYNPCVTGDTIVPTKDGLSQVVDLIDNKFDTIVDGNITPSTKKGFWKTGNKDILKLQFKSGRILKLTDNHQIMTPDGWKEAGDIKIGESVVIHNHYKKDFSNLVDMDDNQFKSGLQFIKYEYNNNDSFELKNDIICNNWNYLCGIAKGYFEQYGFFTKDNHLDTIALGFNSMNNLHNMQIVLNAFGINSFIGDSCEEYDYSLQIQYNHLRKFNKLFGSKGSLIYKKLNKIANSSAMPSMQCVNCDEISNITSEKKEDVYDCTIPEYSAFDANGVYVHNCVEINLYSYDDEGNSGWQQCNLTEINAKEIKTREDFELAAKLGSLIGTLQAGYTEFKYLGPVSEFIMKRESLIGVSFTGMMDSPEIMFDAELQKEMAQVVVATNKEYAEKIGINQAARCTCVKPSGCQVMDTMLTTDQGILTLEEIGNISGEQWQEHNINVLSENNYQNSNKFYVNGYKETKKITLESGIEIEATHNHQMKVFRNSELTWVRCDEIQEGDMLPYKVGGYSCDNTVGLTLLVKEQHFNANKIKTPLSLNKDLCWLLGLYNGDGSNHKKGVRIHGDKRKLQYLERAKSIFKEQFGLNSNYGDVTDEDNRIALYVNSVDLNEWLKINDLTKNKSPQVEVPLKIRQSDIDCVKSYIDGYWAADGCMHQKQQTRNWVTTSKKMSKQLPILLRAIGQDCSVREMPPTESSKGNRMRYWIQERKGRKGNYHKSPWAFAYRQLDDAGLQEWTPDFIISIEDTMNNTYDIEVPDNHCYIANSYLSHNTTSCILNTASGVHPHHSSKYFRRVQANTTENVFGHFKQMNPMACEKSVWNPNGTDEVITFCIEAPEGSVTKNDVTAIELLEKVKLTQNNWVRYGKVDERCVKKWLCHNVSNTINVRPDEWEDVARFIYDNQDYFAGVSLLSHSGDLDYPQAPFCSIISMEEIIATYGECANDTDLKVLISEGLRLYNSNLWAACDNIMGFGENLIEPHSDSYDMFSNFENELQLYQDKIRWISNVKSFSSNHFDGDNQRMVYLLKRIHNWDMWINLKDSYKSVDYSTLIEETNETKINETIACAGGVCNII